MTSSCSRRHCVRAGGARSCPGQAEGPAQRHDQRRVAAVTGPCPQKGACVAPFPSHPLLRGSPLLLCGCACVQMPRYARVNTLKCSVEDAVKQLAATGATAERDTLIANLLRLPSGTDLHNHPLVVGGSLVLQDKASCFSAAALLDGLTLATTDDVVDACAAPGNKTRYGCVPVSLLPHRLCRP